MSNDDAPIDSSISIVTPENIAFQYQLAGPFRRLPAYLIDIAVRMATWILLLLALTYTGLITLGGTTGSAATK